MSQFYYLNDEILGSCHLAVGERNTVLFDPGMAWYGEKTVEKIKEIIGDRPIDAVFLTHSHYDHAGALPVIGRMPWYLVQPMPGASFQSCRLSG